MSSLTRNVISNVIERAISTTLTLVILPFQVRLLGIEAYGILGFVASLQVLFSILDFGLSPTIIREVAGDTAGTRPQTRALFQTLGAVYWTIACATGFLLAASAPWIAKHWLRLEALPVQTVVLAIRLIAVSILLRWPVALYAGAIAGAQRLDVVNAIRIAMSVLKLLGGLIVLLYSTSLVAYLQWIAFAALVEVCGYMLASVRVLPHFSLRTRFSRSSLSQIWRFSLHMNFISLLAVLFVQGDRLIISRVLPIAELGFYSVAYSFASGLSMLQNVVTTALFPALVQQAVLKESIDIRRRCASAVQLLMYVSSGVACVLIFYGRDLLAVWISADTAAHSARPLAVLALGFMVSAAVAVPYTLAIAAGQTTMPLIVNLVAGAVYVPAVYWLVHTWGIDGAAWAWVGVNTCYVAVLLPLIRRGIPMDPFLSWCWRNVLPFVGTAVLAIGVSHVAARHFVAAPSWLYFGWLIAGAGAYALTALLFLDDTLHSRLTDWRRATMSFRKAPNA